MFCAGCCDCAWNFRGADDTSRDLHETAFCKESGPRGSTAQPPYGFTQYEVHSVWRLAEVKPAGEVFGPDKDEVRANYVETLLDEPLLSGGLMRDAGNVVDIARCCLPHMSFPRWKTWCDGWVSVVFMSVALTVRTHIHALIPKYPPASALKRWRTEHGAVRQPAQRARQAAVPIRTWDDIVLELPRKRVQMQPMPRDAGLPSGLRWRWTPW